jgi:hypothetical protein
VKYDDETLMAYADGEFDEAKRAEIAAAVEKDPELGSRVQQFRSLRTEIAGAYSAVLDQPVPDRLRDAARDAAKSPASSKGNVVQFPTRGTRAPPAPWRGREWFAMAASLVLGVLLSWKFLVPGGDVVTRDGSLLARGELARALDSQLASTQGPDSAVFINVSFKATDGSYCRSFVARDSSTAGVACRAGEDWRVGILSTVELPQGDLRQAAAALPVTLINYVESRMAAEALDVEGEAAARDRGWAPAP